MANYVLGRGKLFFDQFTAGATITAATRGGGELYLGNTPEFNLTQESNKLDHFNSDAGLRVKDKSVLLELNRTGNFITDNISVENLAMFFLGQSSTVNQASATAQTYAITGVLGDRYYQIGESASLPAGIKDIASLVITNTTTPATVYVLGTDYTVDLERARIYVPLGSAMIGVGITCTYNVNATTYERITTLSNTSTVEGKLRFVSENAEGTKRDIIFPYVKLSPAGDFALKGDEWQQLGFDVEILKKADGIADMYIDGLPA